MGVITNNGCAGYKYGFARQLRKHPTPAEACLWARLSRRQQTARFRRQTVLLGWIVDFYCHAYRLVVEVDGSVHAKQREADAYRDTVMTQHGFKVLRFSNFETITDTERVLAEIRAELVERT